MSHLIATVDLAAWTPEQFSALGSMLGGVGSIAAVIGAAALLLVEIRGRRVEAARYALERREQAAERREQEARQRDDDARQARLIIADQGRAHPNPDDSDGQTLSQDIDVANHSDAFVFDVIVRIPGTVQRQLLHFITPGGTKSAEFRGLPVDYDIRYISCGGPSTPYELRVTLEFTDASGRRWRREGWDQPERMPTELADSTLYRSLPPFPVEGHPYDSVVELRGVQP